MRPALKPPGSREISGRRWPEWAAALIGLVAFCLLLDPSIIDPANVGWLAQGDSAQSYLGWLFFRNTPWTFPLGAVHALGLEQSSSIVFTDSIPALAIACKLLRGGLPATFQYAGLWLCACYVLQGYFSCRLLRLFTQSTAVLVTGVLLFVLSPIMLLRANAHLALTAHWLILAALYLYYAPISHKRWLQWLALLWFATLIHAYLMVMVYVIWVAYLMRHGLLERNVSRHRLLIFATGSVFGSLLLMWLVGYFMPGLGVSSGGFGYYSMNLLAPVAPIGAGPFLLPAPGAATTGQYEGFNYLGLGVLMALLAAVPVVWQRYRQRRLFDLQAWRVQPDSALILCCLGLFALAVSNVVTLGAHVLFTVPLDPVASRALNIFRASGRLFWPTYYLLILLAMRGLKGRSVRVRSTLLIAVVGLQLADLSPFMSNIHRQFEAHVEKGRFPTASSPFWAMARSRYANISVIPGVYAGDESIAYEYLAGSHGFGIDSAYYSRTPAPSRQQSRQKRHVSFFSGQLDQDMLYLVQSRDRGKLKLAQGLFPSETGVGEVDGFTVVAPHWFSAGTTKYLHRPHSGLAPIIELGRSVHFGKKGDGVPFMLSGWSTPGKDATWSIGSSAELVFRTQPTHGPLHVMLDVRPYLPSAYPHLTVDVLLRKHLLAHWVFVRGETGPQTNLEIPQAWHTDDANIVLKFRFHTPRSPFQSGESADRRRLALLLRSMRVQEDSTRKNR